MLWLNGVALPDQCASPPPIDVASPAAQNLDLHPGWNALRLRGFAVGYQLGLASGSAFYPTACGGKTEDRPAPPPSIRMAASRPMREICWCYKTPMPFSAVTFEE